MRRKIAPPVPAEIEDEFALLTAARLQAQTRLLYIALLLTVPTSIYAAAPGAPFFIRIGLPAVMGLACLLGALDYFRRIDYSASVRLARAFVGKATTVSTPLAAVCSAWCVGSFLAAPPGTRAYYPLILAMGSLATAYCLSSIRLAAVLNLVVGLAPISILMLLSGDRMNLAGGASLILATAFLLHMIWKEHGQLIDLLLLQRKTRILAETDPLTGLLNRRAFDVRVAQVAQTAQDDMFIMGLIDLDEFKPINDRYGHAVGDAILCQVADRLRAACGDDALAARIGGDEFAVLVPTGSRLLEENFAEQLRGVLCGEYRVQDEVLRVSASAGFAAWPEDGRSTQKLYEAADRGLYKRKEAARTSPSDGLLDPPPSGSTDQKLRIASGS
ncbi:hypothetical protein B5C34_05535 [Pacificimonas flava]|uniref:diguanylate cyclase n=1 Tax=Pacificimonas flava TaxID=1234595 RepID=A0A219BA40_9SPHN|nr:hypothetical protein B5C34_05535 [Pacificimonas flava]